MISSHLVIDARLPLIMIVISVDVDRPSAGDSELVHLLLFPRLSGRDLLFRLLQKGYSL